MQHEHVDRQLCTFHPFGFNNTFLVINTEMATDGMDDLAVSRKTDGPRQLHHLVNVVFRDQSIGLTNRNSAAVHQSANVAAGGGHEDLPQGDVTRLFGVGQHGLRAERGTLEVDDLALADP